MITGIKLEKKYDSKLFNTEYWKNSIKNRTNTFFKIPLHLLVKFSNGYYASVINDGYGHAEAPFELAVMDENGCNYSTPITNDVLGHLNFWEVIKICYAISKLPAL